MEVFNILNENRLIGSITVFVLFLVLGIMFCIKHKGDLTNQMPAFAYCMVFGALFSCGSWHVLTLILATLVFYFFVLIFVQTMNKLMSILSIKVQ